MMADVTTLQSELAGSGAQFAELMVRLGDETIQGSRGSLTRRKRQALSSRGYKALEARSADTATISHMRFRSKEASDFKPNVWTGEKTNESFTAFKMELQNWVGALHDHMLKVMELAETKEGRITEADVRNTGHESGTQSMTSRRWIEGCTSFSSRAQREKQRTVSATPKGQGSKPGSRWSVILIRERVRTDLSRTRG